MASPQWKNFQPSLQDSAIHAYQCSSFSQTSSNGNNNINKNSSPPSGTSSGLREAGIVEKLLHSYGFIQCCERQARLFFHYSQFSGNIEHLKLGDPVEFEMTYDRRTGKPIASAVVKISTEALSDEVLSSERVSGFVTTEVKNGAEGRVAYESRGECFFLPYTKDDLERTDTHLNPGDKVTFQIATDKCSGNLRARNIVLEVAQPRRYQGVICGLKETFGFIERADVVKEIFFHSSECKDFKNLNLGDDVEFTIQIRNSKEVAINIVHLPLGTVVFDDVSKDTVMGHVIKTFDKLQTRHPEPMSGKIRYRRDSREMEISFGEKDTKGDFTLQVGDWVQFNIATDRRDKLQHATNIDLLDESFLVSGEMRDQGIIVAMKENYGFIKCDQKDSRIYFRTSELLDSSQTLNVQDEVEFTVMQECSSHRYQAIRIRKLSPGSIKNSIGSNSKSPLSERICGIIEKEPSSHDLSVNSCKDMKSVNDRKSSSSENEFNFCCNGDCSCEGVIAYNEQNKKKHIHYHMKDCDFQCQPHLGDKVEFTLTSFNANQIATDIKIIDRNSMNGYKCTHRGFIAALKDGFGFIETEDHDREIFFHCSVYEGNINTLEIGQEVEYSLLCKGSKLSADNVRKLPAGTIPCEEVLPEVLNGIIIRPVRCFNPEQDEYCGLIQVTADENMEEGPKYSFGITSLTDKHEFLQKGDVVQFQIGIVKSTGQHRAVNIRAIRTCFQATVETIKGNFGFLSHEVEEGKKLFFHMSEVKGGINLQPGDKVEFVVVHHQRTGKYSACRVVKIGESQPTQRPERLISRLRSISHNGNHPRVVAVRLPKGPDGTNGFKIPRRVAEDTQMCESTFHNPELADLEIESQ